MDYQHPAIEQLFLGLEEGISKAVDYMKSEYSLVRPGRANPKLLERIYVDYYGTNTPVHQMSNTETAGNHALGQKHAGKSGKGDSCRQYRGYAPKRRHGHTSYLSRIDRGAPPRICKKRQKAGGGHQGCGKKRPPRHHGRS